MDIKVEALYCYPVKSCAGMSLDAATLTTTGFELDRKWMLVNQQGRALTQRQYPKLALISTQYGKSLQLNLPTGESCDINHSDLDTELEVGLWSDKVLALGACTQVQKWLRKCLSPLIGLDNINLVHFNQKQLRKPAQPERFGLSARHFADAAPYLLANSASLKTLNKELASQDKNNVDMRRFRPNIVVSGLEAFAEHKYKKLILSNGAELELVDHCERCVMITVDPDTGTKHQQQVPFRELAKINAMPHKKHAPAFGVNVKLANNIESLDLHIGDTLQAQR